jgi:hypothetical protein
MFDTRIGSLFELIRARHERPSVRRWLARSLVATLCIGMPYMSGCVITPPTPRPPPPSILPTPDPTPPPVPLPEARFSGMVMAERTNPEVRMSDRPLFGAVVQLTPGVDFRGGPDMPMTGPIAGKRTFIDTRTTDSSGRFEFGGLDWGGYYEYTVRLAGYEMARGTIVAGQGSTNVVIRLVPLQPDRSGTISGVVRTLPLFGGPEIWPPRPAAPVPVPGARVILEAHFDQPVGAYPRPLETTTDGNGNFRFIGVAGRYDLRIEMPQYDTYHALVQPGSHLNVLLNYNGPMPLAPVSSAPAGARPLEDPRGTSLDNPFN